LSIPYRATRWQRASQLSDIENALEEMKRSLELTQDERWEASYYQNLVRDKLKQTLGGFQESFLTGSYARHTAIAPLNDIDIFVVIDEERRHDLVEGEPSQCINAVRAAAADALQRMHRSPIVQRRSVGLKFERADLKIELVPAFRTNLTEVFRIADRHSGQWIYSAPNAHSDLSTLANSRSGGFLKPVIKMLKAWKRMHDIPLKSFHLEVMCYGAMPSPPPSLSVALGMTFRHLRAAIQRPCADPTAVGTDIDVDLSREDRVAARMALEHAFYAASEALRQEFTCVVESHNRWKDIFGERYPRDYWRSRRG